MSDMGQTSTKYTRDLLHMHKIQTMARWLGVEFLEKIPRSSSSTGQVLLIEWSAEASELFFFTVLS